MIFSPNLYGPTKYTDIKIILHNAALCIIRYLALHHHDCRVIFTTNMSKFVDLVRDVDENLRMNMNANRKIGDMNHFVVYQRDALEFLHYLSEIFCSSSISPKLIIAGIYLE